MTSFKMFLLFLVLCSFIHGFGELMGPVPPDIALAQVKQVEAWALWEGDNGTELPTDLLGLSGHRLPQCDPDNAAP